MQPMPGHSKVIMLMLAGFPGPAIAAGPDLWELAGQHAGTLRFSTLFTAQDVRNSLSKPEGLEQAMRWCRDTGVTHVYIESFRDGYTAEKDALRTARKAFESAGFLVSGCVTPTKLGRRAVNGWEFPCFSEQASRDKLRSVFEFTAPLFDEIMIDDFFATKCECDDCTKARGPRSWSEYRLELLADVSRRDVLEPARRVNPKVQMILKYPQWYDQFHERGYDVAGQPKMFEKIWVGTETRDPDNRQWGRKPQYEAYFIMRWLSEIGGAKCGGGWFDPYGTSPATYVEQARQTILGGAREALLFCYGSLIRQNGPANVEALRSEMPQLFELAALIKGRAPRGIAAPKPPNSPADGNEYVYDFIGMLGLPLVPTAQIRETAPAAFLSHHALKDPELTSKIRKMSAAGTSLLMTRQLAAQLKPESVQAAGMTILDVPRDAWDLMQMPQDRLAGIRAAMLKPFGVEFEAPTRVALYLFGDDLAVVENFNDADADVRLALRGLPSSKIIMRIPAAPPPEAATQGPIHLPKRSLVVLRFAE